MLAAIQYTSEWDEGVSSRGRKRSQDPSLPSQRRNSRLRDMEFEMESDSETSEDGKPVLHSIIHFGTICHTFKIL